MIVSIRNEQEKNLSVYVVRLARAISHPCKIMFKSAFSDLKKTFR